MSVGFKKSLFGFNCADVINYINKTHKTFIDKENDLNSKIGDLQNEIKTVNENIEKISAEKLEIEAKLNEFYAKSEEIERLSKNIGKLYLVAQENARAIMDNSECSAKIINEEVSRNLYTIDEAHESLSVLRKNITKTSEDFVNEVESLMNSLSVTKEQIAEKTEAAVNAKEKFEEIYSSIVK